VSAAWLSRASHHGRNRRLQPLNPLQNPPWRRDDDSGSRVPVTAGTDLVLMLTRSGDPVDPTAAGLLATTAPYPCTLADDGDTLPRSAPAPGRTLNWTVPAPGEYWSSHSAPLLRRSLRRLTPFPRPRRQHSTAGRWSNRSQLPRTGPHPPCRCERECRRTDVGTGR